jgi:hypothetical protein
MIKKKQDHIKTPINLASFRRTYESQLLIAKERGDKEVIAELESKIMDLDEMKDESNQNLHNSKMAMFSKLNSRNRDNNFKEGREAEKQAIQERRVKGVVANDPFARLKTAPKHVVK